MATSSTTSLDGRLEQVGRAASRPSATSASVASATAEPAFCAERDPPVIAAPGDDVGVAVHHLDAVERDAGAVATSIAHVVWWPWP